MQNSSSWSPGPAPVAGESAFLHHVSCHQCSLDVLGCQARKMLQYCLRCPACHTLHADCQGLLFVPQRQSELEAKARYNSIIQNLNILNDVRCHLQDLVVEITTSNRWSLFSFGPKLDQDGDVVCTASISPLAYHRRHFLPGMGGGFLGNSNNRP